MSASNGDKARFHRIRKQKIARRKRTRELLDRDAARSKSVESAAGEKPRTVPE